MKDYEASAYCKVHQAASYSDNLACLVVSDSRDPSTGRISIYGRVPAGPRSDERVRSFRH